MFSILTKIFGTANDRIIKRLQKEIHKINDFETNIDASFISPGVYFVNALDSKDQVLICQKIIIE